MNIEVLMSCYIKDRPEFLREAIKSTYEDQTVKPDSFRIIVDGPVGEELNSVLEEYCKKYPEVFILQRLPVNSGLGLALQAGVSNSKSDYLLRMDADDISNPKRIEKQLKFAELHPDIDVIGTFTAEFIDDWKNHLLSIRELKTEQKEIYEDAKKRTPVSHVSVLLKRSAVISAGNYQDFPVYEDYYLWIRMLKHASVFANIPEVLVYVRTDQNRYQRKGSAAYIESTIRFQKYLYDTGFINWREYLRNKYGRLLVAKIPVYFRKLVYEELLRKKPK